MIDIERLERLKTEAEALTAAFYEPFSSSLSISPPSNGEEEILEACKIIDDFVEALPDLIAAYKELGQARARIKILEEDADCSDIFEALEAEGVPMGDGEHPQDIITAIEILGKRAEDAKDENTRLREALKRSLQCISCNGTGKRHVMMISRKKGDISYDEPCCLRGGKGCLMTVEEALAEAAKGSEGA